MLRRGARPFAPRRQSSSASLLPSDARKRAPYLPIRDGRWRANCKGRNVPARYMSGNALDPQAKAVKVLTLKSAKGLEFPIVALVDFLEDGWPWGAHGGIGGGGPGGARARAANALGCHDAGHARAAGDCAA